MKRSQIILFVVFLVLTGLIYFILAKNRKDVGKNLKEEKTIVFVPTREVKNELHQLSLISYGQITPNSEIILSFEVPGKLEQGDLIVKPGTNFRIGQILYRVNSEEAFYSLSSRKSNLSNLVVGILPDIELDFPSEKNKWINFLNGLNPSQLLPELPEMSSAKERMFVTSRNLIAEYYNLKSAEARMEKYIYVAPFNGTVITTYAESGSIVNPGGQIAKIAKTGDYEVKVPIAMDDLELYKGKSSAEFINAGGKKIATGKIIRISNVINQQTQSADVYYSISPLKDQKIYNGMFVNVSINQEIAKEAMTLPLSAVQNGIVNVLNDSIIAQYPVLIVGEKADSIFVTGLKNGQLVVLEQIGEVGKNVNYKGITR